jgi:hypothetical protein
MATGKKFEDIDNPHVAVQVGVEGDVGIVEIQDTWTATCGLSISSNFFPVAMI